MVAFSLRRFRSLSRRKPGSSVFEGNTSKELDPGFRRDDEQKARRLAKKRVRRTKRAYAPNEAMLLVKGAATDGRFLI